MEHLQITVELDANIRIARQRRNEGDTAEAVLASLLENLQELSWQIRYGGE